MNQFQPNSVLHRTYKRSTERSSPICDSVSEPHCLVRLVHYKGLWQATSHRELSVCGDTHNVLCL